MSDTPHLDGLSSLSDRPRRAVPKPTPALVSRTAKQQDEEKAWKAVCRCVDERDRFKCRACGRRVQRTLKACRERAEHHHIVPRSIAPTLRFDSRNVLLVCLECHGKLTRHELTIYGAVAHVFVEDGNDCLNADFPLRFVRSSDAQGT